MNFKEYIELVNNTPLLNEVIENDTIIDAASYNDIKLEFIRAILGEDSVFKDKDHFTGAGKDIYATGSKTQARHQAAVEYLASLKTKFMRSGLLNKIQKEYYMLDNIYSIDDVLAKRDGKKILERLLLNTIDIYPVVKNFSNINYTAIIFNKNKMIEVVGNFMPTLSKTKTGKYVKTVNAKKIYMDDHYMKLYTAYEVASEIEYMAYAVKFAKDPLTKPVSDKIIQILDKVYNIKLDLAKYDNQNEAALWAKVAEVKNKIKEENYNNLIGNIIKIIVNTYKSNKEKLKNLIVFVNGEIMFNPFYSKNDTLLTDCATKIQSNVIPSKKKTAYREIQNTINIWLQDPNVPIATVVNNRNNEQTNKQNNNNQYNTNQQNNNQTNIDQENNNQYNNKQNRQNNNQHNDKSKQQFKMPAFAKLSRRGLK